MDKDPRFNDPLQPGEILKLHRERSRLKQSALAKEISDRYSLNISRYRLGRIELGEYEMSWKEIQAFSDFFGCPAETYRTSRLIPESSSSWFS